jgi:hypothetical protein
MCEALAAVFVRLRNSQHSHSHQFPLGLLIPLRHILGARAHGLWTYEPRQGRKAATVVCSASAVVTLAF